MKHPMRYTAELITWFVAAVAIGLFVVPYAARHAKSAYPHIPIWGLLIALLVGIGLGTAFWIFAFKKFNKDVTAAIFSLGIGTMIARTATAFYPNISTQKYGVLIFSSGMIFYTLIILMRKSWRFVRWFYWIQNLFMILAIPMLGAIIGELLPWWAALSLLALMAVYDAVAVWKTGHMVTLAKGFIDMRILPGICIPYEKEEHGFALLGGGDIFFLVLVSASLGKLNHLLGYISAVGMLISIVVLFALSKKDKFYPALPFIFAGAVLSSFIWLFAGVI